MTRNDRDRTFGSMIAACGMTIDQAAELLGQSRSLVDKKARGERSYTRGDVDVLSELYERISVGDVTDLLDGSKHMSDALAELRGTKAIPNVSRRRSARPLR